MEDVTIEDEFESNEQTFSKPLIKKSLFFSNIFQIFAEQWIFFLFFIGIIFIFNIYRRRNVNQRINNSHDQLNRYDHMEHIRQQQQKAYEEQAARYAEQQKSKMENLKINPDEKCKPLKYRRNDYNPLTGQSNRESSSSCSWRPSSKGKPAGG